jgi:hypothetical protein
MNLDYKIEPVATSKDDIVHPPLSEKGVIPKLNTSTILVGRSGSGKSVLLHNLLTRPEFFHKYKYWDKIFIISPTAECDDVQRALNIPTSCIFTDMSEAVVALEKIEKHQEEQIKKLGSGKAQKFALIFDDVVGHQKLMNNPVFISSFIKCRHYNFSVFLCSQHFRRIPKICRLQAAYLCFFAISNNEAEMLAEEFAPPRMSKNAFFQMITDTLDQPFAFLTINMRSPWDTRFRKGLAQVIDLNAYRGEPRNPPSARRGDAPQDLSKALSSSQSTVPAQVQRPSVQGPTVSSPAQSAPKSAGPGR